MKPFVALICSSLLLFTHSSHARVQVLTSIAPLHQIAMAVMDGVDTPERLVQPGQSAHQVSLSPSDAKKLHQADLILWIGPELESYLERPLQNLSRQPILLQMTQVADIDLLPTRAHIEFDAADDHEHDHDHDHVHGPSDPHVWLSPRNAKVIAEVLRDHLVLLDPHNSAHYLANTAEFIEGLQLIDRLLHEELAPYSNIPFLVFHDAYQYFESDYGLSAAGTIHLHPHSGLSVSRVHSIRDIIHGRQVACVFKEPQFTSQSLHGITDGLPVHIGTLDPLGINIVPSKYGYFQLLENLSASFMDCLQVQATEVSGQAQQAPE